MRFAKTTVFIPVCPEQLGGLSTPRELSEKKGKMVFTRSGKDVTMYFRRGARNVLGIAKSLGIKRAVFAERSPSCGSGEIYDGSFSGKVIKGDGVTTALLKKNGIKVIPEGMAKKLLIPNFASPASPSIRLGKPKARREARRALFVSGIFGGICRPNAKFGLMLVFACTVLSGFVDSHADTIRLKNQRTVEGEIVEETEKTVVVDIGLGTVAVSKEQIESIEDTPEGPDGKEAGLAGAGAGEPGAGLAATEAMRGLSDELRAVKKKRLEAVKHKSRHESLRYKVSNIERELTSLYVKFENLNNKLRRMKKDDIIAYNSVVADINSTNARISKFNSELAQSNKMREDLDAVVSESVSAYNKALIAFTANFDTVHKEESKKPLPRDAESFYLGMKGELDRLKRDFEHKEIEYSGAGSEVIVSVTLNNKVKASMVLDTGASILLISRDIANQLNIYDGGGVRKIQMRLANGTTAMATPVVLHSVEVGDALVKNVRAAISETPPSQGVDGLLGMSFLSNFVLRIDSKANKLILEEFKPAGE